MFRQIKQTKNQPTNKETFYFKDSGILPLS